MIGRVRHESIRYDVESFPSIGGNLMSKLCKFISQANGENDCYAVII